MKKNKSERTVFSSDKLKGIMREKGLTQNDISQKIGINKSTFNSKINGQVLFTQDEIANLLEILQIPDNEIKSYFFTEKV